MKEMESDLEKLQKIFDLNLNYSFLIGAGISMNPPSNMPSSGKIIENLIDVMVPIKEVNFFKSIKEIKFEHIIEGIQKYIDKDLQFFNFFIEHNVPNSIHYILAKLLISDNHKFNLITTNFDCLIEYSLIQQLSEEKCKEIDPIILKDDFLRYSNSNERNSLNQFPIYKIHGSVRNIIKKIDTKNSIIATFSSLGKNRPAGKTYGLEDYKFAVFKELLKNSILIVLGYSGSDLLDIIPSLIQDIGIEKIIWIKHIEDENPINIQEIQKLNNKVDNKDSTQSLLRDIMIKNKCKAFLIETNSQKFVEKFLVNQFLKDSKMSILSVQERPSYPIIFKKYIKNLYESHSILKKYEFAYHLCYRLSFIDDSLRINERALDVSIKMDKPKVYLKMLIDKTEFLSKYDKIKEARFILEKFLDDLNLKKYSKNPELEKFLKFMVYRQLSILYRSFSDINKQMMYLNEAINLADSMSNVSELRFSLMNELAMAFMTAGAIDSDSRSEYLESALNIFKDLIEITQEKGDLINKAGIFGNIGSIYYQKEEYMEAIKYFKKSLEINKIIGNHRGIAIRLHDIGENYRLLNESKKALKYLNQSRKIYNELNLEDSKDSYYTYLSLGNTYMVLSKFNLARENFKIAKKISEKHNFQRNEPLKALIVLKRMEKRHKKKQNRI